MHSNIWNKINFCGPGWKNASLSRMHYLSMCSNCYTKAPYSIKMNSIHFIPSHTRTNVQWNIRNVDLIETDKMETGAWKCIINLSPAQNETWIKSERQWSVNLLRANNVNCTPWNKSPLCRDTSVKLSARQSHHGCRPSVNISLCNPLFSHHNGACTKNIHLHLLLLNHWTQSE